MLYETASEALENCAGVKLNSHHACDVVNERDSDTQLLVFCF